MSVREPGSPSAWRVVLSRVMNALPVEPPEGARQDETYTRIVENLRAHAEEYLNPDDHNYLEGKVVDGKLRLDICEEKMARFALSISIQKKSLKTFPFLKNGSVISIFLKRCEKAIGTTSNLKKKCIPASSSDSFSQKQSIRQFKN